MPQQLKNLLQHLYPSSSLSNKASPASTAYKKNTIRLLSHSKAMGSPMTPTNNTPKRKIRNLTNTDSGVDLTSTNYVLASSATAMSHTKEPPLFECSRCSFRESNRMQLESNLKHAFVKYLREPSESNFANIPVIVVKSFDPAVARHTRQLDQIKVRKNNAVNALFMKDNKWVYVKTSDNVKGFVPKKVLEPFQQRPCSKNRTSTWSPIVPKAPSSLPPNKSAVKPVDHTYMTINELDVRTSPVSEELTEETDLALLSVSNCSESAASASQRLPKNLISRFAECVETPARSTSKASRDLIRLLANSKSRNRKISIAFRQLSSEASLTMLEQQKSYINLNECKERTAYENCGKVASPKGNKVSSKKRDSKLIINYENLTSFKSVKRVKNSSDYSYSSSSSPSSIEYDAIATSIDMKPENNYYLNSYLENSEDDQHIYDHLSSNNSKILNMYKVVEDYKADFKGDLTVRKGDIVYLMDSVTSPSLPKANNDYLFVRIYKRGLVLNSAGLERSSDYQNVQGYIPRTHVIKV